MPLSFGDELKQLREAAGLTQTQLARAVRLPRQAVSGLEHGHGTSADVRASVLFALADVLGVPADHFRPWLARRPRSAGPAGKRGPKPNPTGRA